jgi:hypothetical protein
MDKLIPEVAELANELLRQCKAKGIPIKITETWRSPERQAELYKQGTTQIKTMGMHYYGVAFDVCVDSLALGAYNPDILREVGKIGKSLGLTWGGDWKTLVDMPHFQLDKYGDQNALAKKYGTYEKFMEENAMTYEKFVEYQKRYEKERGEKPVSDYAKQDWDGLTAAKVFDGSRPRDYVVRQDLAVILKRTGAVK